LLLYGALLPSAHLLAQIPFAFLLGPFFLFFLLAGSPVLSKKAPYIFWGFVCALWMVAGLIGFLLAILLHLITGKPL
jgi:hypothetical protein